MATNEMTYQDLMNYISANKSLEDRFYTDEGGLNAFGGVYGYGANEYGPLSGLLNANSYNYKTFDVPGYGRVQLDPTRQTFNQFENRNGSTGMYNPGSSGQNYTEIGPNGTAQKQSIFHSGLTDKIGGTLPIVVPALMAAFGGAAAMGAGAGGAAAGAGAMEGATAAEIAASSAAAIDAGSVVGSGVAGSAAGGGLTAAELAASQAAAIDAGAAAGTAAEFAAPAAGGLNSFADYLKAANSALKSPLGSLATSAISGIMGSRAADKAADAQTAAAQGAIGEQRRQYDQTRADLAPYRNRGYQAGNQLAVMMGLRPDAATYGNGDPAADPNWMKGIQTAPKYQAPAVNSFAQYAPFKRG